MLGRLGCCGCFLDTLFNLMEDGNTNLVDLRAKVLDVQVREDRREFLPDLFCTDRLQVDFRAGEIGSNVIREIRWKGHSE